MLTGMHQNFLDDATIQTLHHLHLTRGDDFALPTYHFIDITKAGPDQQHQHRCQRHPDQQTRAARLLLTGRPLGIGLHVIRLVRTHRFIAIKQPAPPSIHERFQARRLLI